MSKPPTARDFERKLKSIFRVATKLGATHIGVSGRNLHRAVGGYTKPHNRMPSCCQVMLNAMAANDQIISAPPKGKGATLTILYKLPR